MGPMKKIAIAAVLIIVSLIIYFVCSKPEKSSTSKTALLTDNVAKSGDRHSDSDDEEEADVGSNEKGRGENVKNTDGDDYKAAPEDTVTFRVQGESGVNTYKSIASFTKISASPEFTGYLANFAGNINNINVSNQSSYTHVISVLLPTDVTPGTFTEKSNPFIFQFFGSDSGVLYTLDQMCSFSLTIDEWGGPGGRARGTFSGELKAAEGTSIISVRDGSFNVGIK
jgi:hypothetical protein